MSQINEKMSTKPAQYTRKKIENYSYGLNDVIGKGYSSQVYKGRNDANDTSVAIKVIDLKMLKNEINRVLLESEIQILKQLNNKQNILALHDVYTTKNNTYIITELCSSDMNKIIQSNLTETQAYVYMTQLIDGYKQIYNHQIVHRDLKPANLLVTDDKRVKIADFGFGIKTKELTKPSKYNVGSPLYMAPQSLKKNQYSFKTDLWAIGIIFYEMLTGNTPWRAKTQKQLIKKIESQNICKLLQKKNFTKMTTEFLERILCFDKEQRMSPEQLDRYNFNSTIYEGILIEKTNININRTTRFDSLNSINASNFVSPKHMFNQSIEKNFFQKQTSERHVVIPSKNSSSTNLSIKTRKQTHTMKEINQNNNPLSLIRSSQKKNLVNPEILKSEDKKLISKVLISIVHFCRFLYKLLMRVKSSQSNGILKEIGYFEVQGINYSYTKTIKYLINLLLSFPKNNFLKIQNIDAYKQTSDFTKLMKIAKQYCERYSNDLNVYWSSDDIDERSGHNNDRFSTFQTNQLIKTMSGYADDIVNGMQDPQNQVAKLSKDIVIIDYLMTAKQLLEMFENGIEDYFGFAKKSRIQDIVDGSTSDITYSLFKKIIEKANIFVSKALLSPLNSTKKGSYKILKGCSNSFNNTGSSWRCVRGNNNFSITNYNR